MNRIPKELQEEANAFPPVLRALLDVELAAGNEIAELGHGFPSPPVGAYIKLKRPISTRARASGDGLKFRDYRSSTYSGSFTDDQGYFFLLEPPEPPPPIPNMDAIRRAANTSVEPIRPEVASYAVSMHEQYEKWHESTIGAEAEQRSNLPAPERTKALVKALQTAEFYGGLTQAIDEAEEFHPPEVVDALFKGALHRDGEAAVHFAALLMFIHGKAPEAFDWGQRPFFLRFNTADRAERETAFRELCDKTGVAVSKYL
jgi:hypothetical protein